MYVLVTTDTEVQAWGPFGNDATAHKFAECVTKANPTHIARVVMVVKTYNGDLT
jgi:hypothetical protein